jgi:hypothetical protein
MSTKHNPSALLQRLMAMQSGMKAAFTELEAEIRFGGEPMTMREAREEVQEAIDALSAVRRAELILREAVRQRNREMARFRRVYEDGVLFLRNHFGREADLYADFGVKSPKPRRGRTRRERSAATLAKAHAARRAVREATAKAREEQRLVEPGGECDADGATEASLVADEVEEPEPTV